MRFHIKLWLGLWLLTLLGATGCISLNGQSSTPGAGETLCDGKSAEELRFAPEAKGPVWLQHHHDEAWLPSFKTCRW